MQQDDGTGVLPLRSLRGEPTRERPSAPGRVLVSFAARLDVIRKTERRMILSSHLPGAAGEMKERLLSSLAAAPTARPFVGPDQAGLEQKLTEMNSLISATFAELP